MLPGLTRNYTAQKFATGESSGTKESNGTETILFYSETASKDKIISPKLVVLGDSFNIQHGRSIHCLTSTDKSYEVCLFKPQQSSNVPIEHLLFALTSQYSTDLHTNGCIIYCDMTNKESIEDLKRNILWAKDEKKRIDNFYPPKDDAPSYFIVILGIFPEGGSELTINSQLVSFIKTHDVQWFTVSSKETLANVLANVIKQNYKQNVKYLNLVQDTQISNIELDQTSSKEEIVSQETNPAFLLQPSDNKIIETNQQKLINEELEHINSSTVISPKLVVLGDTSTIEQERSIHLLKSKDKTYEVCLFKPQQYSNVEIGTLLFALTSQYSTDLHTNGCIIYCDMTNKESVEDLKKNILWAKDEKKRIDNFYPPKPGNPNYFIIIVGICPDGKSLVYFQQELINFALQNNIKTLIIQYLKETSIKMVSTQIYSTLGVINIQGTGQVTDILTWIIQNHYGSPTVSMNIKHDQVKGKTDKLVYK